MCVMTQSLRNCVLNRKRERKKKKRREGRKRERKEEIREIVLYVFFTNIFLVLLSKI